MFLWEELISWVQALSTFSRCSGYPEKFVWTHFSETQTVLRLATLTKWDGGRSSARRQRPGGGGVGVGVGGGAASPKSFDA